jgi:hypothetical protein
MSQGMMNTGSIGVIYKQPTTPFEYMINQEFLKRRPRPKVLRPLSVAISSNQHHHCFSNEIYSVDNNTEIDPAHLIDDAFIRLPPACRHADPS